MSVSLVGNIVEGHLNDTPLAGLNWAALYKWPGEIKDGNGKRQIVIDERADEAQRIALEKIISGEAGAPLSNLFSVFASTCAEFYKTMFLPIDLEANFELRTARVDIPGVLKSSGRPIINEFTGQPFHIALARRSGSFEFTYAEIGLGTTSVTVIWRWRTKIHGRTIAFTTSIRMGWSAKDQGSQHGSASETVARITILSQAIRPAPAAGRGRQRKSSGRMPAPGQVRPIEPGLRQVRAAARTVETRPHDDVLRSKDDRPSRPPRRRPWCRRPVKMRSKSVAHESDLCRRQALRAVLSQHRTHSSVIYFPHCPIRLREQRTVTASWRSGGAS